MLGWFKELLVESVILHAGREPRWDWAPAASPWGLAPLVRLPRVWHQGFDRIRGSSLGRARECLAQKGAGAGKDGGCSWAVCFFRVVGGGGEKWARPALQVAGNRGAAAEPYLSPRQLGQELQMSCDFPPGGLELALAPSLRATGGWCCML